MSQGNDRSVHVGGNVHRSVIVTGDRNKCQLVIQATLPPRRFNMKEFLIIRADPAVKPSALGEPRRNVSRDYLDIAELDSKELFEVKQDPRVEVVAPAMPLSLVMPFNR